MSQELIHDRCGQFNFSPEMEEVQALINSGQVLSPELARLILETIGTSTTVIEAGAHFNLRHFLEDLERELAQLISRPATNQLELSFRRSD